MMSIHFSNDVNALGLGDSQGHQRATGRQHRQRRRRREVEVRRARQAPWALGEEGAADVADAGGRQRDLDQLLVLPLRHHLSHQKSSGQDAQ